MAPTGERKHPRTCKGVFSAYTQALRDLDLPEEDIRVLNKIIPDFLFDLQGAGEAFEGIKHKAHVPRRRGAVGRGQDQGPQLRLSQGRVACRGTAGGGRAGLPEARGARRGSASSSSTNELNGHSPLGSDGPMVIALKKYNGAACWSS